ncbi:MAG TPA: type II secretion system protein [Gemmatimonadales bacterium]|jgi:prepilin-type N-terminal cleavage/methylation domain-containing protein|nr:type II secretion system protein [Gemmatimonadales bacterium]
MRDRRGFTLIEMMVALAISGTVLAVGGALFGAVQDAGHRLRETRVAADRRMNRIQWLREAFRTLQAGGDTLGSFSGGPERVDFSARMLTSRGRPELIAVTLGVSGRDFRAILSGRDTLVLAQGVNQLRLDYLLEPGEQARWAREWRSPSTAPLAVRLRMERWDSVVRAFRADTLLFLIGERA